MNRSRRSVIRACASDCLNPGKHRVWDLHVYSPELGKSQKIYNHTGLTLDELRNALERAEASSPEMIWFGYNELTSQSVYLYDLMDD